MRTYLFTYTHAGADWGFNIVADSPEDARDRVAKLAFARYEGELLATVPASMGWLARLVVATRNALTRARRGA